MNEFLIAVIFLLLGVIGFLLRHGLVKMEQRIEILESRYTTLIEEINDLKDHFDKKFIPK